MLELLLDKEVGDMRQRNNQAKLPFEMPHNDILNAESIKAVVQEYRLRKGAWIENYVVMDKEPDYIFVVNKERINVLTDQLK